MKPQLRVIENNDGNSSILALEKLDASPLVREPFEYVIVTGFIKPEKFEGIVRDYPQIKKGGSFPLKEVGCEGNFKRLIEELDGEDFRLAVERKFSIDLKGKPTMFTVRGKCRAGRDGKIHTDSESKIITLLLYMNHEWENQGGKLRLLRSENLDDVIAEVPPVTGTLLLFKRADNSFHGHKPFTGDRKVIQMNWVTDQKYVEHEQNRHSRSSWWKKLFTRSEY